MIFCLNLKEETHNMTKEEVTKKIQEMIDSDKTLKGGKVIIDFSDNKK